MNKRKSHDNKVVNEMKGFTGKCLKFGCIKEILEKRKFSWEY